MICSTDPPAIVPLSADVTTANVSDKPVYPGLISCLSLDSKENSFYGGRSRL